MLGLLHDPQTSGGLLIAVPAERTSALVEGVRKSGALCAEIIGEVTPHLAESPYLEFV